MQVNIEQIEAAFASLSLAVDDVIRTKGVSRSIASDICCAVAEVISAAKHGSNEQRDLMDAATRQGFEPSYYNNTIRVGFTGTKVKGRS
jgi:hypothetical protein